MPVQEHKIAFQVILHEVFVKSYKAHVQKKVRSPQSNLDPLESHGTLSKI